MKKIITLILSIMMLGAISLTSACQSNKMLIVYTEAGFAPWEFTQAGSTEVIGVDIEIAKANAQNVVLSFFINSYF